VKIGNTGCVSPLQWIFVVVPHNHSFSIANLQEQCHPKLNVMESITSLFLREPSPPLPPELQTPKKSEPRHRIPILAQLCLMHNSSAEGAKQACHKLAASGAPLSQSITE
jgi:hypothetical protein